MVLEPTVGGVDRERVKVARENAALADVDELPENVLAFDQYKATFEVPFCLYADFECYVTKDRKHVPLGYCLYTVSDYEVSEPKVYSGENVMDSFFKHIYSERDRIAKILQRNVPMNDLTPAEQKLVDESKKCVSCNKPTRTTTVP